MEIIDTEIKDVKILKPQVFGDERGFFMETWRDSFFRENVADKALVQDNHSKSRAHVLRGLADYAEAVGEPLRDPELQLVLG